MRVLNSSIPAGVLALCQCSFDGRTCTSRARFDTSMPMKMGVSIAHISLAYGDDRSSLWTTLAESNSETHRVERSGSGNCSDCHPPRWVAVRTVASVRGPCCYPVFAWPDANLKGYGLTRSERRNAPHLQLTISGSGAQSTRKRERAK